jgi:excisionase family DNA binding protein
MRTSAAPSTNPLGASLTNATSSLPRLRTPRELYEQTGVPVSTWYTLVARGDVPAVRIGRSVRLREPDVVAYLESRTGSVNPVKAGVSTTPLQLDLEYASQESSS